MEEDIKELKSDIKVLTQAFNDFKLSFSMDLAVEKQRTRGLTTIWGIIGGAIPASMIIAWILIKG